jgi:hypothetical protein
MFPLHHDLYDQTGVRMMNVVSLAGFSHMLSSLALDDSSLALIALLAGMAGGWSLTGWREQLKTRRAKAERKPSS